VGVFVQSAPQAVGQQGPGSVGVNLGGAFGDLEVVHLGVDTRSRLGEVPHQEAVHLSQLFSGLFLLLQFNRFDLFPGGLQQTNEVLPVITQTGTVQAGKAAFGFRSAIVQHGHGVAHVGLQRIQHVAAIGTDLFTADTVPGLHIFYGNGVSYAATFGGLGAHAGAEKRQKEQGKEGADGHIGLWVVC